MSFLFAFSAFASESDFRSFSFGTSLDSVVAIEGEPDRIVTPNQSKNLIGTHMLEYSERIIAGYSAQMQMEFLNKSLISGSYLFKIDCPIFENGEYDPNTYIPRFLDLKSKLISMYGKPDTLLHPSSPLSKDTKTLIWIWHNERRDVLLTFSFNKESGGELSICYVSPAAIKRAPHPSTEGL